MFHRVGRPRVLHGLTGAGGDPAPSAAGQDGAVRVVVLADTHAPRRWRVCPPQVAAHLRADLILHAGDVCVASVLTELSEYAPLVAVLGNNDGPDVAGWGAARPRSWTWTGSAWRWGTTAGPPPDVSCGCAAGSPPRISWCSGIRTYRSTNPRVTCGSSTQARPRTADGSRTGRSACCGSTPAASPKPASCR